MATLDITELLERIDRALPARTAPLTLHEPTFQGHEWDYVKDCLDTGWVSTAGTYVDRFEHALADYTGARHAIAVVNGTAALHICLLLVDVRPGDEVVIPSLTFIATANAVSYCGAMPFFADSCESTLGMDPAKLNAYLTQHAERSAQGCRHRVTGRRIAAVVPMHTFGHPTDIDGLLDVCGRFGLPLVEDAAESLGSRSHGRHTGTFGLLGALSFNGNKIITTGGGGAILTDDTELARRAKHLTTTARLAHRWSFIHDEVGYNYRMPNLNAALGCAQVEQLPEFLRRKRALAARYDQALAGMPGLRFFREAPGTSSNYWLNTLLLEPGEASQHDAVLQALNNHGLGARPVWTLMHRLGMYERCPRTELETAEDLERRIVNIPSSSFLGSS